MLFLIKWKHDISEAVNSQPLLPCSLSAAVLIQKQGRKSYAHRPDAKVKLNLHRVPKSREKLWLNLGHYSVQKIGIYVNSVSVQLQTPELEQYFKKCVSFPASVYDLQLGHGWQHTAAPACSRCRAGPRRSFTAIKGSGTAPVVGSSGVAPFGLQ